MVEEMITNEQIDAAASAPPMRIIRVLPPSDPKAFHSQYQLCDRELNPLQSLTLAQADVLWLKEGVPLRYNL
jgi:hypothetical protein